MAKSTSRVMNLLSNAFSSRVLYNKFVLYFLVFLSFFHLVGSALLGDYPIVVAFILVGFLTTFFCKNMVVVLTLALVVSHLLRYGVQDMRVQDMRMEGMSTKDSAGEATPSPSPSIEGTKTPEGSKDTDAEDKKKKVMDMLSKISINKKTSDINGLNDQYKDLIGLQGEIMDNVDALEAKVLKAQEIFTTVKENLKNHLPE